MSKEDYPPLITPDSPSYERAQRAFEDTAADRRAQAIALLARLSEAEQNASVACGKAAGAPTEAGLVRALQGDAAAHAARRDALGRLIERLGGSALRPEECRDILTRGPDALEYAQSQADVRRALALMREELSAAYREAIESADLDEAQRAALAQLAPSNRG